eukprot:14409585-Alexandrium_andersonii.AAC.1
MLHTTAHTPRRAFVQSSSLLAPQLARKHANSPTTNAKGPDTEDQDSHKGMTLARELGLGHHQEARPGPA